MARPVKTPKQPKRPARHHDWKMLAVIPGWVLASFIGANLLVYGLLQLFKALHISPTAYMSMSVFETIAAAVIYLLAFVIAFSVPYFFGRGRVSLKTLGLTRLMTWSDIGLAPLAFIAYIVLSWLFVTLAVVFFPWFSPDQAQDVGFRNLTDRTGYLLAFTTLVIVAPIAEELLFRGYLYGKLRKHVPIYAAILMTSLLFGAVHLQWNVGVNVFALSIVMCGLRELTGSIWAGILLHMIKNALAFYILFIAPLAGPLMSA